MWGGGKSLKRFWTSSGFIRDMPGSMGSYVEREYQG